METKTKKPKGKKTISRKPAKKVYSASTSIMLLLACIAFISGAGLMNMYVESKAVVITTTVRSAEDSVLIVQLSTKWGEAMDTVKAYTDKLAVAEKRIE